MLIRSGHNVWYICILEFNLSTNSVRIVLQCKMIEHKSNTTAEWRPPLFRM